MSSNVRLTQEELDALLDKMHLMITHEEVQRGIANVGREMMEQLAKEQPILLCVMNGGVVFMGNLLLQCPFPLQIDYVHVSRYRGETSGSNLSWLVKPQLNLEGRTVVVVDDILDEGITLAEICNYCREEGATKVLTAVLVDKVKQRPPEAVQKADFTGVEIVDRFVLGYGMDYHEYFRNLPGIYVLDQKE